MYTISWYIVLVEWNKGMHLADDHASSTSIWYIKLCTLLVDI